MVGSNQSEIQNRSGTQDDRIGKGNLVGGFETGRFQKYTVGSKYINNVNCRIGYQLKNSISQGNSIYFSSLTLLTL
jgi:hypothetical protein